jgi:transglutaminase-like putative cysteine protease
MARRHLTVALLLGVLAPGPAAAQESADPDELSVFEADLGPAWIDVSAYPEEHRRTYALFAQKCSKCHTLARPINSSMRGDEWQAYVARMSRKPGSGISPGDADGILDFLLYDSATRERKAGSVDPELAPFLGVCAELAAGVKRFPASTRDIRSEDGVLEVNVEGDRRLDLSKFLDTDDGQELSKWNRRTPNRAEVIVHEGWVAPADGAGSPAGWSASPALREVMEEAVGDEPDPRERVELILDWLDESIAREYREGTADPEALLADRRGDSTEHARMFCAMARACGLPARTRVGFVAQRTAFYLHAWAEVRLDDGWVGVDPYLGQLPADPTHIRLAATDGDALDAWDPSRVPGLDRLRFRVDEPEDEEESAATAAARTPDTEG